MRGNDAVAPSPGVNALVHALVGLASMAGAWSCSTLPRPDDVAPPTATVDPRVSCDELDNLYELAPPGQPAYAVIAAQLEPVPRRGHVMVTCVDGRQFEMDSDVGMLEGSGFVRVEVRRSAPDRPRVVDACLDCSEMPPRIEVPVRHRVLGVAQGLATGAGAIGAWLFIAGWIRRPYQLRPDAEAAGELGTAVPWLRPGVDQVVVDGASYGGPRLGIAKVAPLSRAGPSLEVQPEGPSQLVVPGTGQGYRGSSDGWVHVTGPATVLGLPVAAGARAIVLDGDTVRLGAHREMTVRLPQPGVVARFFALDEHAIRIGGRFPLGRGRALVWLARALLISGVVLSIAPTSEWALAVALPLILFGLALTLALPRQLSRTRETRVDAEALARLLVIEQPLSGTVAIALDGRTIGHLPADNRPLSIAMRRELETLSAHARSSQRQAETS